MLFSQPPDELVLLVKPHGTSAALGCHEEDADMRVCGTKGEIQVSFYCLVNQIDGQG